MELVFLPGFSTKDSIDELSGRGVGMDVIKTTIEGLRGRVQLRSSAGRGSRVLMTVPLTLAFIEAMVVRERDRLLALPIEKVFEVFKIGAEQRAFHSADGQTMLRVRDRFVPVCWLHRYFEEPGGDETLDDRVVVVVQTSQGNLALPVDRLLGNQQIMLKPLRGLLSQVRGAAGCGMLRSGDVALAIDCERLHA
ncbi:MAG TPA: chemotaxis protein CheW, partial [Polyangiaceae bacterium]|nr:chemotaxis protein CheW [Polyangiaceae bacterium]